MQREVMLQAVIESELDETFGAGREEMPSIGPVQVPGLRKHHVFRAASIVRERAVFIVRATSGIWRFRPSIITHTVILKFIKEKIHTSCVLWRLSAGW